MVKKSLIKKEFDKRGISGVVETILLILLVVVAIGILVAFLVPFVNKNLDQAGTCLDTLNQVKLNPAYTCYYKINMNNPPQVPRYTGVLVGVETGKIKMDKLLIVISGAGESKSIEVVNGAAGSMDLMMYNKNLYAGSQPALELPGENEGKTYRIHFNQSSSGITTDFKYKLSKVEEVKIAPIIKGKQCDVADHLFIADCPEGV